MNHSEIDLELIAALNCDDPDFDEILSFIEEGADVNLQNFEKDTPLTLAAYYGNHEALKRILVHNPDIDSQNNMGRTALVLASRQRKNFESTQLLINAGANLNLADSVGQSALYFASTNNDADVVKILLDAGADVSIKNKWGYTALSVAQRNHNQTATDLIETYIAQKEVESSGDREESISLIMAGR